MDEGAVYDRVSGGLESHLGVPLPLTPPMPFHALPREGLRALRNLPVYFGLAQGARECIGMQGGDL